MAVRSPLANARQTVGASLRRLFGTPEVGAELAGADDPGLFGPESVTWQVHADLSVLVGGIRSLLVQTLHPLAMAGVAHHSNYRDDPLGRLQRTAVFIATTTYGTTSRAEAAIRKVRLVHERVHGTAPDGRPYSASDPALLAWTHYVQVQSFLLAYQRIGPGLPPDQADRYVREMAEFGARLGVQEAITTAAGLDKWISGHPEQRATAQARAAVRFLLAPPLPLSFRAPYTVLLAAAISLIPLRQRVGLGLLIPGLVGGRVASEPAARVLVSALGWVIGPSPALARAQQHRLLAT